MRNIYPRYTAVCNPIAFSSRVSRERQYSQEQRLRLLLFLLSVLLVSILINLPRCVRKNLQPPPGWKDTSGYVRLNWDGIPKSTESLGYNY